VRWRSARAVCIAAAALAAAVTAGCTIGPDPGGSGASLTVTRDFGAKTVLRASTKELPEGETVMRLLQRRADVETRYGGRFVNAIEGIESGRDGERRRDWFYYVNGIEADVSAAEKRVEDGDRVWWDFHDWGAVMRVPAVVGSFPEPFLHGSEGKRFPVRIDCAKDTGDVCRQIAKGLERERVDASTTALGASAGQELLRFVVGVWDDVRADAAVRQLEDGPRESGVFARVTKTAGPYELLLLDSLARPGPRLRAGAGLVAATRFEEQQPTWIVAGTDELGLRRAAKLVTRRSLRDRFAVATDGRTVRPLPLEESE
jgi:hypothetical protein